MQIIPEIQFVGKQLVTNDLGDPAVWEQINANDSSALIVWKQLVAHDFGLRLFGNNLLYTILGSGFGNNQLHMVMKRLFGNNFMRKTSRNKLQTIPKQYLYGNRQLRTILGLRLL